jgi:nucleoside 2-deoxyribosyltransferase
MKVIYVAGPFRAATRWEVEQNVRRAEELALRVWQLGAVGLCVHSMCRFFEGEAPDETWLDGDLEVLRRCDAVIVARNWSRSTGTRAELEIAHGLNKPIFYDLDKLTLWLESERFKP